MAHERVISIVTNSFKSIAKSMCHLEINKVISVLIIITISKLKIIIIVIIS